MTAIGAQNLRSYSDVEIEKLLKDKATLSTLTLQQVEDFTFRLRQLRKTNYSITLMELPPAQTRALTEAFTAHATAAIAEWSLTQPQYKNSDPKKKLASVYHRAPHGAEMRKDAELFLKQENIQSIFRIPEHHALFSEMTAAAHAMHDVIQDKGPPRNEIESYFVFADHCEKILAQACQRGLINNLLRDQILLDARVFGWEVIVVGTIFDFQRKMPLIDILNQKSAGERLLPGAQPMFPAQPDVAVACASFAAGKNDTRRMEVVLEQYRDDDELQQLIADQFAATAGDENIFMRHLNKDAALTESEKIAFRHMIGQNCRMICELKTHFAKNEKDEDFATFLGILIFRASEQFDSVQWALLKPLLNELDNDTLFSYFELFISSFEGSFGEIAFAKGLNAAIFKDSLENFNRLYPQNRFSLRSGEMWNKYAIVLEVFIKGLRAELSAIHDAQSKREFIVKTFIELALYGGHQIGNALLRLDENLPKQHALLAERVAAEVQPMFHRPLLLRHTSSLWQLAELQTKLSSGAANIDDLTKDFSQLSIAVTMGRKEFTPQAKKEGLWRLAKVRQEKDRLQRQMLNKEVADHRKAENGKEVPERVKKKH